MTTNCLVREDLIRCDGAVVKKKNLEAEAVRLTVCDLYKLILRAWLMILVGMVFTTETFVRLLYVLF
jgi:hypothetical protein